MSATGDKIKGSPQQSIVPPENISNETITGKYKDTNKQTNKQTNDLSPFTRPLFNTIHTTPF